MFLNQDESAVKRRENFQKGKEVIVVSGAVLVPCVVLHRQSNQDCLLRSNTGPEWLLFQMDILGNMPPMRDRW